MVGRGRKQTSRSAGRHHLLLVPGFGGFDALGSLRYYHGVTEVLNEWSKRSEQGGDMALHYFPNLPTASVRTRAQGLQRWLNELYLRRIIGPADRLHFIGHSTGGLDLRQLLTNFRKSQERASGQRASREWPPMKIASVQFLSTPHAGTTLAYHLSRTPWRFTCQSVLRATSQVLRLLGEQGSGLAGRLGRWVLPHRSRTPDWIDAALDTLMGCYGAHDRLAQADARSGYFTLLRWLQDMGIDFNAITDLDPYPPPPGTPASPVHQDEEGKRQDLEFLRARRIRVRSIVTLARSPSAWPLPTTLYGLTYGLTVFRSPKRFQECTIRELFNRQDEHLLRPSDNDGFVNSVSQVWPTPESSFLVKGDHADVIGHYRSSPTERGRDDVEWNQYDLLGSQSDFSEEDFRKLWTHVASFALGVPTGQVARRHQAPEHVPAPSAHVLH
jgi:hypothetical protein